MNKLTKLKSATLIYGESYQDAIPAVPAQPARTLFTKINSSDIKGVIEKSAGVSLPAPVIEGGYRNLKIVKPATQYSNGAGRYDYLASYDEPGERSFAEGASSSGSNTTHLPYLSFLEWVERYHPEVKKTYKDGYIIWYDSGNYLVSEYMKYVGIHRYGGGDGYI